ncbi:diguanylate cyclase (GGDEF)-like protein [Krasilnikovia cinnamomea]|uniref:Diguanylate cyclase (GGDEF)-like protein n=2 Tax=Krasilnikovia cinnamomea TaxID=349313 RepID=A0A4Q7ZQH4_9ACTN|nr:diguanylate cyclase (GGDEF)-like protein [Krasilnikovia cinnamomea]
MGAVRRSTVVMLTAALIFLIAALGSAASGRANTLKTEQSELAQRSAVGSHKMSEFFERASTIVELGGRNYSFVDYYGGDAYGDRGHLPLKAKPTDQIVERVNQDLAHMGRMYADRIGAAAFIDVSGVTNAAVIHGKPVVADKLPQNSRTAPYFQPVFGVSPGVVRQSRPYRSPTVGDWVISSGTQVLMPDHVKHAMVHFEITVEGFRRELDGGYGHLLVVDAATGAVVIDSASPQQNGQPLGDPGNHRFTPLVGQWQDAGLMKVDGRQAAYHRVPSEVGNDNHWYVVTVAPAAPGPFTGVGVLPGIVVLTAALIIVYAVIMLRKSQSALVRAANTDPLTGLRNRRRLEADLAVLLPKCTEDDPLYLTLSDLNGFKAYNDTLGHPVGDTLLARLGQRLSDAVQGRGGAYRIGGDEFCVVARASDVDSPDALIALVSQALREDHDRVPVTASHGLVVLPQETSDLIAAMSLVDRRMYQQKHAERVRAER